MRAYFLFLKENFSGVVFGWLLTFFSSFGQTFLISLYVPGILESFHLTNASFGVIYAVCTVLSSIIMLTTGHAIDHSPVRKMTYFTLFGLVASCIVLGMATHPIVLIAAMIGLRLTGQGLMSHISLTVMSRYYHEGRGKALSLSSLGYSAGEAVFPILITFLILQFGWRFSIFASAGLILVVLFPLLIKSDIEAFDTNEISKEKISQKVLWKDYWQLMKGKTFWRLAPAIFMLSFIITGLFFYQIIIATKNHWPHEQYALCFTGYAIARFLFSLIGGTWVDRWSANTIFSFYLFPLCAGLAAIVLIHGISGAFIFLLLTGISIGLGGPVKAAIIAEVYGIEKLGAVRSLFTVVMVVSTALGPLLVGYLLDANFSLNTIIMVLLVPLLLAALNCLRR